MKDSSSSTERLFFSAADFPDGEIHWNSMEADFDVTKEDCYRDLLLVVYANACSLFLAWYQAREGRSAYFGVALSQNPEEYEPFAHFECTSIAELRSLIRSCAIIAAQRPSIRRRLSQDWRVGTQIDPYVDRLVLDPLAPLV